MIRFGQDVCGNLEAAIRREWVETNGLGAFASSTINGLNTRRYDGLVVTATKRAGSLCLVVELRRNISFDGRRFDLSANRYPGVIHPQGLEFLKHFRLLGHLISKHQFCSSDISQGEEPKALRKNATMVQKTGGRRGSNMPRSLELSQSACARC